MGLRTVKVKKWIADTKINRKLHSVLECRDGEILIEMEEFESLSLAGRIQMAENLLQSGLVDSVEDYLKLIEEE